MNVDLSKAELELLDEALKAWQGEPHSSGMSSAIFAAVVTPREERDPNAMKTAFAEASVEVKKRELKALPLRAKLMQVLTRETEHAV